MAMATTADAARRSARVPVIVQRLALALLLLALWWLVSLTVPPYVLPRPERVFARIVQLSQTGDLPINLLTTLGRVLAGFALAVAIGVPGGILLGSHRALGTFFEPILPVLNTVSSAIWAIFALIWFGLSPMTPIFVVLMTAFPLIVTNVWQGTQAVNADFVELAQALRFSRWKTLTKNLSAVDPALFLFRRAARFRLRLAREPGGGDAWRLERRRLSVAPGVRPDSDGSGLRLDHRAGRDDAGDRDRHAAAARTLPVPLAARHADMRGTTMNRRDVLAFGLASLSASVATPLFGQGKYPERPIKLMVAFSAGGVNDVVGRQWAERVKTLLGSVYVENQGGAGGTIATGDVARAPGDGYTLLLGSTSTMVLNPMTMARVPYDPAKDFVPVAILAVSTTSIVVHASVPVQTLPELIAYAKANPGKLSYGSAGSGTMSNLSGELFKQLTGLNDLVHIPYKGAGPGITDLVSGHIPMMTPNVTGQVLEFHRAGKIRILAVNAAQRTRRGARHSDRHRARPARHDRAALSRIICACDDADADRRPHR